MTPIQKILVKSWIVKTSVFALCLIALVSHILLWKFGNDTYSTKVQPFLGELFVSILLGQYLLSKKCWYSWGAIFGLFINNLINVLYILTSLPEFEYKHVLITVNYLVAFILATIYLFFDNSDKQNKVPISGNNLKIGGGVAIGKKPTHVREIIGDKLVFIDLSVEGRFQFEVFHEQSTLMISDPLNFIDYESALSIITEQVNQI